MTRALWVSVLLAAFLLGTTPAQGVFDSTSLRDVSDAITELDVERAREMIGRISQPSAGLAIERARLALYLGDCDSADATLSSLESNPEVRDLSSLAKSCARAVAGARILKSEKAGLWIRLQNDADEPLVPFLTEVAVRARAKIESDLGVVMPRPLRIDLVSDLFTLAAITGLPLKAAETTGTVAVARWGRVTMLSPRAATLGYPWQDTLAHEITHLALARATRDHAPLWLQEGVAKREETRWRPPRPFDDEPDPNDVARQAIDDGEAVGIGQLGASIAMLPSPRAASIAFAEVESFIEFFVKERGPLALSLLLRDLKGLGDGQSERALRSVTGLDLDQLILTWQASLLDQPLPVEKPAVPSAPPMVDRASLARSVRAGDLLQNRSALVAAERSYREAFEAEPSSAALRWRLGRTLVAMGQEGGAEDLFDSIDEIDQNHAGWYALRGRFMKRAGRVDDARKAFELAIAHDPLLEDAACEGQFRTPKNRGSESLPKDPARRALCEAARKIRHD